MEDRLNVLFDDVLSVQLQESDSIEAVDRLLTELHIDCKPLHPILSPSCKHLHAFLSFHQMCTKSNGEIM